MGKLQRPMARILLVIEDDVEMRRLIDVLLSTESEFEVAGAAEGGESAIQLARSEQPDLIILDHFIEGEIMGLELAPKLKEAAPASKLILFTSHDLRIEASREQAIDAFLSKADLEMLIPTMKRLTSTSE